jgi:ABC-type antimicrobial peptide transport system permease subunit
MVEGEQYQPLPSFVSDGFLDRYWTDLDVLKARILVRMEPDMDIEEFKTSVLGMSENVEAIYTVAELLEAARGNIFLQGPRQVQGLGIVFATLVSSVGVALVVSTTLRERQKEITLMAIRGFSFGQLFKMLVIENVGVVTFSMLLGATVGYINVVGDVALTNVSGELILSRIVFPQASLVFIAFIVAAILLSVIAPIIYVARRTSSSLSWRIIE